jgi:hypothetical protein
MQVLEEEAESMIRIESRKCKRPNALGSSKGRRFELVNQRKRKADFVWSPKPSQSEHPIPYTGSPRIGPPRPPGWKHLVWPLDSFAPKKKDEEK